MNNNTDNTNKDNIEENPTNKGFNIGSIVLLLLIVFIIGLFVYFQIRKINIEYELAKNGDYKTLGVMELGDVVSLFNK